MKKTTALLLSLLLAFAMTACKGNKDLGDSSSDVIDSSVESIEDDSSGEATGSSTDSVGSVSSGSSSTGTTSQGTTNVQSHPTVKPDQSLLDGLDFKGKTFSIAYTSDKTPDADEKAFLEKFKKQYNCRIVTQTIPYDSYLDALSKRVLSGGHYDALMLENTFFPNLLINNLAVPLDDCFGKKDLYDPNHIEKGGISLELSECFRGKDGKLYAVADPLSAVTGVYFYNKQALADAGFSGAKDPYTLWTKGKWTWAAFEEMAKAFANPAKGTYLMETVNGLVETTGASYISRKSNTEFSVNLTSDQRIFAAFDQIQKWINAGYFEKGKYAVFGQDSLVTGKYPMAYSNVNWIDSIKEKIAKSKSPAWSGGDVSLLGFVPPPQQKEGTHYLFASAAPVCVGAGKGTSDPRFAVAYMLAKSNQSYYPSSGTYAPTTEERKMINDIAKVGKVNIYYQGFRNTTVAAYAQSYALQEEIMKGQDITKTLQKYQSIMKGLVDGQMKSWK